jgi:copper chaperone NosL
MRKLQVWVAVIAVVAASCASAQAGEPPEINYGRDICIQCGMVIEDDRFAAAYRLPDGTEKRFDDLGGLILHGRDTGELHEATVWVHDFETREWVDATKAFYVPTLDAASPMGHGILAFSTEDRAAGVATDLDGEVLPWETVVDLPVVYGLVGDHDMTHEDHMDQEHEHDSGDRGDNNDQ